MFDNLLRYFCIFLNHFRVKCKLIIRKVGVRNDPDYDFIVISDAVVRSAPLIGLVPEPDILSLVTNTKVLLLNKKTIKWLSLK